MGIQFVRRETEDILNRLSVKEGRSKAQIIHECLMDREEGLLKQELSYKSSSTMAFDNKPKSQGFVPTMTPSQLQKRIEWYKKQGLTDAQILEMIKIIQVVNE